MQRLGGTHQMWTLLSFTGRFDVAFLEEAIAKGKAGPPSMPGETTEKQKQKNPEAQMARARLRRGAMLQRLQEKLSKGTKRGRPLNSEQLRVLQDFESGKLRREANDWTLISGHGRLRNEDGTFVDIGGSTGGFVRTVLDDWESPDTTDFQEELADLVI